MYRVFFSLSTTCSSFNFFFHFHNLLSWVTRYVYFLFTFQTAFVYRCYGIHTPFTWTRAILCCFASTRVIVRCNMRTWKSLWTLIVSLRMESNERRCWTFEIWLKMNLKYLQSTRVFIYCLELFSIKDVQLINLFCWFFWDCCFEFKMLGTSVVEALWWSFTMTEFLINIFFYFKEVRQLVKLFSEFYDIKWWCHSCLIQVLEIELNSRLA